MSLPSAGLALDLDAVGLVDAGRVGRKAATLGELKRAGFPVPEGMVLTTEALVRTLAAAGLGGAASPEQVLAAALPAEVAEAIGAAAEWLGSGRLAVRSSGVDEDLAGASYAGQYESVLDVPGDRLAESVRRCWASAFAGHVVAYRRAHGGGSRAAMAVLVLPMVAAEAAGVAFSADPVTGDRATAVVSAVRGLGERLVGGQVSPDEWEVRDGTARCRAAPEGAIDAQTAVAVAALARRVQEHFGAPQDIEWAWAAGELVLLQARPITALPDQAPEPVPVPVQMPPGFWQREASHAPKPLSPMLLSVLSEPRRAIRQAFAEFGALAEGVEFRDLGGWQYTRLVPLGGKDRPPPPGWLLPLLVRVVPRLRRRVREAVAAISTDKAGRLLQRCYEQWRPQLAGRIPALREVDLGALDDQGLDDHTAQAVALLDDGLQVHFLLHAAVAMTLAELTFACRELLGWSDEEALELLGGLSVTSTRPAHRLAELACLAANRPAVGALLGRLDASTADRLADVDLEFAAAFAAYQRDFGHRALRYELADPTIAELPELTLRLLADQVSRGYDPGSSRSCWPAGERRRPVALGWPSPATRPASRSGSSAPWPAPSGPTRSVRSASSSP